MKINGEYIPWRGILDALAPSARRALILLRTHAAEDPKFRGEFAILASGLWALKQYADATEAEPLYTELADRAERALETLDRRAFAIDAIQSAEYREAFREGFKNIFPPVEFSLPSIGSRLERGAGRKRKWGTK